MMSKGLLAGSELHELIEDGVIDALHENVNASSIDVRIGDEVWVEAPAAGTVINLVNKEMPAMTVHPIHGVIDILPLSFVLAHTIEKFNLPDTISAEFKLRSSVARAGLNHHLAGWADAGWYGAQLTMELFNACRFHSLRIEAGMRIGQMVFYRHTPAGENSYALKGRYNGTVGVSRKEVA